MHAHIAQVEKTNAKQNIFFVCFDHFHSPLWLLILAVLPIDIQLKWWKREQSWES